MAFGSLSLKGRALRWLAQREHSRAELERKLRQRLRQDLRGAARPVGDGTEPSGEGSGFGAETGPGVSSGVGLDTHPDGYIELGPAPTAARGRLASDEPTEMQVDAQAQAQAQAEAQIDRLLDELTAAGLLSDDRAAASLIHRQAPRLGARRLKQALQARGLAPELVAHSLQQLAASETDRAAELWRRRFAQAPRDAAERARQSRFLLARGFAGDVVAKLLRETERTGFDSDSDNHDDPTAPADASD